MYINCNLTGQMWSVRPAFAIYMGTSKVVTVNPTNTPNRGFRRISADQHYNYNVGDIVSISCYTTCAEVELLLNHT